MSENFGRPSSRWKRFRAKSSSHPYPIRADASPWRKKFWALSKCHSGQAQVFTDPRHALQQRIVAAGDFFGLSLEFFFECEDLLIEMANHGQVVFQSDLAQRIVFGRQQLFLPGIARAPGL